MNTTENLPGSRRGQVPHEVFVQRISLETESIRTLPYLKTSITSMLVRVREPNVSDQSTLPLTAVMQEMLLKH